MKVLIGATGLTLFLYLIVHVVGNAMVFFGPIVFNKYAHTLEANPLVPIIEIGLLLEIPILNIARMTREYVRALFEPKE